MLSLLKRADAHFVLLRFVTPKDGNAHETLVKVLELDPGNERALKKIQEISEIYRGWGKADFRKMKFSRARGHFEKVLLIHPEDRGAQDWLEAIEQAGEEVRITVREPEEQDRLALLEQEQKEDERTRREEVLEEVLQVLRREGEPEAPPRFEAEDGFLRRVGEFSGVEGVWRVVRTGEDTTDGGTPFPSERTLTLVLRADGSTLRGSMSTHSMGTLPSENFWADEITNEHCGKAPDGRVRHAESRQPLGGTVFEGEFVHFTSSPGEIVVDDCSLLQKHGADRLLDTGSFNGELSPDGSSITLDWEWAEFLGGGNIVLKKVDEEPLPLVFDDPGVRGATNLLIVYEDRYEKKQKELVSQLRALGYNPRLGNVSKGFSCSANARSLALGGGTDPAVLDELRSKADDVMPNFFTEWLDDSDLNHIYLCG